MSDGLAAKLDRLLRLAVSLGYQGAMPREIRLGEVQEFARLHAEVVGLMEAGAKAQPWRQPEERP